MRSMYLRTPCSGSMRREGQDPRPGRIPVFRDGRISGRGDVSVGSNRASKSSTDRTDGDRIGDAGCAHRRRRCRRGRAGLTGWPTAPRCWAADRSRQSRETRPHGKSPDRDRGHRRHDLVATILSPPSIVRGAFSIEGQELPATPRFSSANPALLSWHPLH